jgi:pyruvate/2-oxoglutarate/acetoin dehydrogenase E1 component
VREHAQKKQKLADEVRRTGGAFGETKELLQKYIEDERRMNDPDVAAMAGSGAGGATEADDIMKAHIVLPSQDAIAAALVEQKKKMMLDKYGL